MTNLSREFCLKVREARKAAGLSQSELAMAVGCRQSAISMFEKGDGTKLGDETIAKIAEKFSLKIPKEAVKEITVRPSPAAMAFNSPGVNPIRRGFCPNRDCPSNHAYAVEERTFIRPDREAADPVGGKYCAICGEILEKKCPNCGAPVHDGAVCSYCGEPYIAI